VTLQSQSEVETPLQEPPIDLITSQYRRYALFLLFLVFTSSHVDRQILAILLESIKHELVLSDMSGVMTSLTLLTRKSVMTSLTGEAAMRLHSPRREDAWTSEQNTGCAGKRCDG
jgi:hypothetical protein